MSDDNPFAMDAAPEDPHNPYAAPQTMDEVVREAGQELASRRARLGGAIVDGLTMIPLIGVIVVLAFRFGASGGLGGNDLAAGIVSGLVGGVLGTLWHLILNGYLLATRGQTIGKLVAGTRIVDAETDQLVPLLPLILKRWISIQVLSLIPVLGGFLPLIDSLLIFRENRRCLHDDFAGTKVIKVL